MRTWLGVVLALFGSFSLAAYGQNATTSLRGVVTDPSGAFVPGATVTLLAERRPDAVTFSVTDQGPGIPPDLVGKVFDWFESHSLGSQHRGPGVGLSLVRSFVELHGGTVTIDSAVGQGTTVTCTFPSAETAARTAA